jgi:alkanesulfonate monooxygenase SsuD/methylene tetrahydromethanopterin reductase-like flavin-dependent oxidoreductase (luciferase family)
VRERHERFAEFVELLDLLLTEREVDFGGRFWSAVEARTYPGCVQQPRVPFAVAATGPRSMRVAAMHAQIWVTNGDRSYDGPPLPAEEGAAAVGAQLRRFEQICEDVGRDPATVDKLVLTGGRLDEGLASPDAFRTLVEAYGSVGMTDVVVHWPRPEGPYAGDDSILDEIAPRRG